MALAAVATLAVSAVAAPRPPTRSAGSAPGLAAGVIGGAIVGGALAGPGYYYGPGYYGPGYGYYGGPAYVADRLLWRLLLAAAAFLGRLWLADSPRAGVRLIPFTFVKTARHPGNGAFSGMSWKNGLKKPFFQPTSAPMFTFD